MTSDVTAAEAKSSLLMVPSPLSSPLAPLGGTGGKLQSGTRVPATEPASNHGINPMKRSERRILTTHVGSLSRSADLLASFRARAEGKAEPGHAATLASAVAGVVRRQHDTGIDIVNDGEFGK